MDRSFTVCAAIGLALLVGCGDDSGGLSGKVLIDGSSTVYPISEAAAADFRKVKGNGKIEVTVGQSGTGGGFKRFVKGELDISDASRPITADEFKQCQENKISFIEIPIAYDGLSVVVHPDNNWVKELTVEQIQTIFLADTAAKTWKDVDASWPDEEIKVFAPGTDSGTFDYFKEVVGGKEKKNIRSDMSTSEDDHVLVTGVSGDKQAIGFFGYAYYVPNKEKLRLVPIVNPALKKSIEPTPATIESGDYAPFSRPLFIYVKEDSLKQPQVKKFIDYYLDNAASLAEKVKYVPLPKEVYKVAKEHYQQKLTGTCYLKDDGGKRSGPVAEVYKKENLVKVK